MAIENESLAFRWNAATARFTLTAKPSQRAVVVDGRLGGAGRAMLADARHATFGKGRSVVVARPDGTIDTVSLFAGLPFALFQPRLHNGGREPLVANRVPAVSLPIRLGRTASELTVLGTGGLASPAKNPGSYVWMAIAEPKTRAGVVGAWLTHRRGSGVVFASEEAGGVRVDARLEHGRLRIAPGNTAELDTFAVGYFDDARLGLEAWADAVARQNGVRLPPQPVGYCTWYSQPYGGASDEKHLLELARFAKRELGPFGFSLVQIDDGWQAGTSTNGPNRNFTTHRPGGPYAGGMKPVADALRADGQLAGLWFMPFAGTHYDPFFKDKQNWFVRRSDGKPYETDWGGTCLDTTRPEVRAYLRDNARRIAYDWGYRYFKMDGLWTGTGTKQIYVNDAYREDGIGDAVFADPDKTNLEAYREGLQLVRDTVGRDVFILGCCIPQNMRSYGGAMGIVDAMRIGPDNGSDWNGLRTGPTFGSRHYFLHGRVWYNDPDPVYVRPSVPLHHARLICSWVGITGQMNLSTDWLPGLPPERIDLLRRTMPSHGLKPRPVDLFEEPIPRIWLLTDTRSTPRRDVVALFNWSDKLATIDCSLSRIGLPDERPYVAFDYWGNARAGIVEKRLAMAVPGQSCRILALRPVADHPQLVSTSRHVTQGIVDVVQERWDAGSRSLHGRSRVVAGDRYELRIALPAEAEKWTLREIKVSAADVAAGVKIAAKTDSGWLRATIASPTSREVDWSIAF